MDAQDILSQLEVSEKLGSEILTDRREMIATDRMRNEVRHAKRALTNQSAASEQLTNQTTAPGGSSTNHGASSSKQTNQSRGVSNEKTWMAFGNMFVKMPAKKARSILDSQQSQLDVEYDRLSLSVREKTFRLHDFEKQSPINSGFDLKAVERKEMDALRQIMEGVHLRQGYVPPDQ